MKNLTKMVLGSVSLLGLFTTAAAAQDASDWNVSAAVAVQSDYRFRGISQNDKDPAPQATLNITGPDGWYVGTWMSKVDWNLAGVPNNPSLEVDVYGGKHTSILDSDLNIEAYYYSYPDARTFGGSKASYFEAIGQLSHTFGPVTGTLTYAYSPEFSLGGGDGDYVEGTLSMPINDWLTVSGNVGHQWVANAGSYLRGLGINENGDYTHADLGVTATYKSLSLDMRYVTTTISNPVCSNFYMAQPNACSGGFVATLTYSINPFPW